MKVKVFQSNHNGKIEFTRAELEKLLNEVYTDGYNEGKSSHWTWTSPYYTGTDTTLLSNKTPINQATITGTNTEINNDLLAQFSSTTESKVEAPKITTTNNSTKPNAYTVTMKCSEADINKAANALRELLNTPNALSTAKIDNAFDKLAKELNF
jgi:hypothetical protein